MSKGPWKRETKSNVVYEYYMEHVELSYEEIAEHFGVSRSTINNMLYKERKKRGTVRHHKRRH